VREEISAVARSMQDSEREAANETHLAGEAGLSLETIFTAIEHQAYEIERINQIAHRQLQSARAVGQIMQSVAEYTRRGSRSTHDASRNVERLASLVERLHASVEAFKLRDSQNYIIPNTNISISFGGDDNQLTASGVFHKISTHSQPLCLSNERSSTLAAEPVSEPGLRSNSRQLPFPSIPDQIQIASQSGWNWSTLPATHDTDGIYRTSQIQRINEQSAPQE